MAQEKDRVMDWALTQAQKEFRKVFAMALKDGPQEIRGEDAAVIVVSEADYRKLSGEKKEYGFKEHLLSFPKVEELVLERDKDMGRDVEL